MASEREGESAEDFDSGPGLILLHAGLILAGLGTAMLGPILPMVAERWHLLDSQSGLLMAAKFCGAFLGGVTVSPRLRWSLLIGFVAAGAGFFGFAMAPDLFVGCAALTLGGFGIGRIITATNILAGRRFTQRRGAALALLNFSFSAGAMLSAIAAASLLPRFSLPTVLQGFSTAFAVPAAWMLLKCRGGIWRREDPAGPGVSDEGKSPFPRALFLYFAGLLFLYGGLETCLSGWLTTFALRYGERSFAVGAYTTLLFWMALTAARAGSAALLLKVPERTLQRAGLIVAAPCVAGLAVAHGGVAISVMAVLLGGSLSPFFPATFALLMAERPRAGQAGMVIAVSGLGAAALPWLMGVVSTRTNSLQAALILPFAAAAGLLLMSLTRGQRGEARQRVESSGIDTEA